MEDQNVTVILSYLWSAIFHSVRIAGPALEDALKSNPDLTSILVLLIIVYVSLLILGYVSRMIYAFVMGIVKLTVICLVLIVVLWVAQRGVPGAICDAYRMFDSVDKTSFMKGTTKYVNRGVARLWSAVYT